VPDNPGGYTAYEFTFNVTASSAPHDNKIAVFISRHMDDAVIRLALLQIGKDVDILLISDPPGFYQEILSGTLHGVFDVADPEKFEITLIGGKNRQHLNPAFITLCQATGLGQGIFC
jgi:hypothetical protein